MGTDREVNSKANAEPARTASRLAFAWGITFGVYCLWIVWALFHIVDVSQQFMTLESAARWTVPLKLLECVPLAIPLPALFLTAKRKRLSLLAYASCLGLFSACLPWLGQSQLFHRFENPYNNRRFDAQLWQAQKGSDAALNPRGLMIRDLLANHLHAGMGRNEVVRFLGEPDWQDEPGGLQPSITYVIGLYSGILDHEFLKLHFDAEARLVATKVEEG